ILILELLPIVFRVERLVGIGVAASGETASHASLERERLEKLHTETAGEAERAAVSRGHRGIAPQQVPLRTGPDAVNDSILAVIAQIVPVAIAQKAARGGGVLRLVRTGRPHLLLADGCLVVRHAHVLGPE